MAPRVRILRSGTAGNRPTGKQYGEPYVNVADNQFGILDSSNVPRDLLGVPIFSPAASYTSGNPVNYQGQLFVAQAAVSPGAWNPAQWAAITSAGMPTGTVMLFWQASAPAGWTKITTHNDKSLRVVSGAGGVAGGTNSFSTVMSQSVVGNHTLSISELAYHNHPGSAILGYTNGYYWIAVDPGNATLMNYGVPSDGAGGGGAHNHTIKMDIQYIDLILASKN